MRRPGFMLRLGREITLLVLSLTVGLAAVPAVASAPDQETHELIVLLDRGPGAPSPEDVVEGFARHRPLPGNLATGSPVKVSYALWERAAGDALARIKNDPDSPRARLERFVVLTYPPGTDLDRVQRALSADPHILHVEKNALFEMSASPSDPLFPPTNPPDPTRYQWGSHTLRLDQAWDRTTGHAYVGLTDTGLQESHPDLQGNFRKHLSQDLVYHDNNVDENFPRDTTWDTNGNNPQTVPGAHYTPFPGVGHGTHTSGILAATSNNGVGTAGACWNCSLIMAKISGLTRQTIANVTTYLLNYQPASAVGAGITWLVDRGTQVISTSLGIPNSQFQLDSGCANQGFEGYICTALAYMDQRDVTMFAASGNDETDLQFPASDSRVISAGGIDSSGSFWQPYPPGFCPNTLRGDCGSNYTVTLRSGQQPGRQMLVTPAVSVVSTFYAGGTWIKPGGVNPNPCYDSLGGGYGICTGTSMSSPYAAGVGALVRSANPLLTKANVAAILTSTASNGTANWSPQTGYGIPNASAAVQSALGTVSGKLLTNRLTPLFSLYSPSATDSFYTTVPQMAAAAINDSVAPYLPVGPPVPGYSQFPGISSCSVGPCIPTNPTASVYIFTTEKPPYGGAPLLVPLYRMSYNYLQLTNPGTVHRDTTYTTSQAGITAFQNVGYKLDGIEGYIYSLCTPEPSCIPPGAVRLYRLYNAARDDFAIFPESELATMQANGYASSPGLNDWIGYVYPNVDTDGDGLIDGFETLAGTAPTVADSDCDGTSDGAELLTFGTSSYRDPLVGSCTPPPVFSDVPVGYWAKSFIDTLFFQHITAGCAGNPRRFCPDDSITRADTAVFLLTAKGPTGYTPKPATCNPLRFQDVPCTAPAAPYIEDFARRGITAGCGGGNYCPDGTVSRGTMAFFLLATLGIPAPTSCTGIFSDVPCTAWYAPWVEELYRRGITGGCGGGRYCPDDPTSRAQAAVFVTNTFHLPQ